MGQHTVECMAQCSFHTFTPSWLNEKNVSFHFMTGYNRIGYTQI